MDKVKDVSGSAEAADALDRLTSPVMPILAVALLSYSVATAVSEWVGE